MKILAVIWRCEKSHCPDETGVISGSIASLLCALVVQFSDPARTKPKHAGSEFGAPFGQAPRNAEHRLGILKPKSESGRAGGRRSFRVVQEGSRLKIRVYPRIAAWPT